MSKKKVGRPASGRDDVTVKLDRRVAFQLKQVAGHRRTTLAELLTDLVSGPAAKMYGEVLREIEGPQR